MKNILCLLKSRNYLSFAITGVHHRFFCVGSVLLIISVFCVVLLCVFSYCDVRYNFRIQTMFCSSLPSVVCRSVHVLFTLFVFIFVQWCPTHNVLCFIFLLFMYSMLPVSLDCHFFIDPSVFCNDY